MHFRYFGIAAASFLAVVYGFPIPQPHNSDFARSRILDVTASGPRDLHLAFRSVLVNGLIIPRARTWEQRNAKQEALAAKKKLKATQGKANAKAEEAKAKFLFGNAAREGLDHLGLHGKERTEAKNYHKKVVKADMKTNGLGVTRAKVVHLTHVGGSVASEKNDITVHYYNRPNSDFETIWSKWKDQNGNTRTGELHHVYPDQYKAITPPMSFINAVAKSVPAPTKKQKKEAATAAAKARAQKEKAQRAAVNRAAGLKVQAALKPGKLKP